MTKRSDHYWVAYLATTMATALRSPEPKKVLRPAVQSYMRDGAGHTLRAPLSDALRKEVVDGVA